jgi:hypothetical protein
MILALSDEIETTTYSYADLSDASAIAEADYKFRSAKELLAIAASGIKLTAQEKSAHVDVSCTHEFRAWKIAEARRQSAKEALLSLRGRMDATRTLSANVRHQT